MQNLSEIPLSPQAVEQMMGDAFSEAVRRSEGIHTNLRELYDAQADFVNDPAKRKVVRSGRRGGKTVGAATLAVKDFNEGKRVLYASPTDEQIDRFWNEVKRALAKPLNEGLLYKNETKHIIEVRGTEQRIRAKSAWNADTLRGDYADTLILDEYQLMDPDAWELVGAPMMLDRNGDALFLYTQVRGKHHSKVLFKRASEDATGRWKAFRFSSHANPYLSREALDDITKDMTKLGYRMEVLAEDIDDDPSALWRRQEMIEDYRVSSHPELVRIVVAVDPTGGVAECGIVAGGVDANGHGYVLDDRSLEGSPEKWASETVACYNRHRADRIVGEKNFGGEMVEHTVRSVDGGDVVAYSNVHASRGKQIRAEPVAALYERGMVHHVGEYTELEDELCTWVPGESKWSPNRLDALVWLFTELMVGKTVGSWDDIEELMEEDVGGPASSAARL